MAGLIPLKMYTEDEDGAQSTTTVYVPDDSTLDDDISTGLDDLKDAFQGVTAAKLYQRALTNEEPYNGGNAVAGPYDIADKAVFYFNSVEGQIIKLSLPAPDETLFLDSDRIDSSNALAAAVIAESIGVIGTESGDLAESFAYGERQRSNRRT